MTSSKLQPDLLKKSSKTQEKLKKLEIMHQNAIYIYISWYKKFADFRWKNDDISRTQGVCHVIQIILDLLQVRYNSAKFHCYRICVTGFREGGGPFRPPTHPWAAPKLPILNKVKTEKSFYDEIKSIIYHIFKEFGRNK